MILILQGILFENSCHGISFVWPRRQHKLENNGMDTDQIREHLRELLPYLESFPNLSKFIRNDQVLISKSCFNEIKSLNKCPMKPRYFSLLSFQVNEAFKASRDDLPKKFALVTTDGFKHDSSIRQTKRESTPRKRSGILRCWIRFITVRCWISNQSQETMYGNRILKRFPFLKK